MVRMGRWGDPLKELQERRLTLLTPTRELTARCATCLDTRIGGVGETFNIDQTKRAEADAVIYSCAAKGVDVASNCHPIGLVLYDQFRSDIS